MAASPRIARRAAAAALGFLIVLLGIEAALRVGAHFARPSRAPVGDAEVIFFGDSHIFGLWVEQHEALPAQVEKLSARTPRPIRTRNAGTAGLPSWFIVDDALAELTRSAPRALVVRAGVNNPVTARPQERGWLDDLRVVKLGRIVAARLRGTAEQTATRLRPLEDGPPPPPSSELVRAAAPGLRADLARLAAAAKPRSIPIVVVGYSRRQGLLPELNQTLRDTAVELGLRFVDTTAAQEAASAAGRLTEAYFSDGHPAALGYALEATFVIPALAELGIGSREGVPSAAELAPLWKPEPAAREPIAGSMEILYDAGPRGARGARSVRIQSVPGARGRLVVGLAGKGFAYRDWWLPLDVESALAAGSVAPLEFVLSRDGVAEVELPSVLRERLPADALVTALLLEPGDREVSHCFLSMLRLADGGRAAIELQPTPHRGTPPGR